MEAKVIHFKPEDEWRTREDLLDCEAKSEKFWEGLGEDERSAILLFVREAMIQLTEDPASWVPQSVEIKNDHRIDVYISIHWAEIEKEVVRKKLESERALHEATQGTRAIYRVLSETKAESD